MAVKTSWREMIVDSAAGVALEQDPLAWEFCIEGMRKDFWALLAQN